MINKNVVIGFALFYFTINLLIGVFASLKSKNTGMYFLGSKKISSFILAISFSATSMSGLLFLGFSGVFYSEGLLGLWIAIPSSTIGIALCFLAVGGKIRRYSEYTGASTIIEVLKKRFIDEKLMLTRITIFLVTVATIMYVSGQLIAAGKLIQITTGLKYEYSIFVFSIIMISYVIIGELNTPCWTDIFQGIAMVVGSFIAGLMVCHLTKGFGMIWTQMKFVHSVDSSFILNPLATKTTLMLGITIFIGDGMMNWLGQPTLMTKFMSIRNKDGLMPGAVLSIVFQVILFGGVLIVSLYMRSNYHNPILLPMNHDTETVFIQFLMYKINPLLSGVVLGGIIAAIMSTAESLISLTGSIIVNHLLGGKGKFSKKNQGSAKKSQIVITILGGIIFLVSVNIQSVLTTAWIGWSILGLTGIPIVIGLKWDKATLIGAIGSQVIGFSVLIIWLVFDLTQRWNIFYAFASGTSSYLSFILISLFTKKPPDYIRQEVQDLDNDFTYQAYYKI